MSSGVWCVRCRKMGSEHRRELATAGELSLRPLEAAAAFARQGQQEREEEGVGHQKECISLAFGRVSHPAGEQGDREENDGNCEACEKHGLCAHGYSLPRNCEFAPGMRAVGGMEPERISDCREPSA